MPPANHSTFTTHVHGRSASQTRRYSWSGRGGRRSLLALPTAGAWRRAGPARAAFVGLVARRGRSTRKPVGEPLAQPLEGDLAVARLRAGVGRGRPRPPGRGARAAGRAGADPSDVDVVHVEPHLDPGVRRVGVLAARDRPNAVVRHSSSSRRITQLERDAQSPVHGSDGIDASGMLGTLTE